MAQQAHRLQHPGAKFLFNGQARIRVQLGHDRRRQMHLNALRARKALRQHAAPFRQAMQPRDFIFILIRHQAIKLPRHGA